MRDLRHVVVLYCFFLSCFAYAQDKCATIFATSENLGEYGSNAQLMAPYYISMFRDHQIAAGTNSRSGVFAQDIFNSASLSHTTLVSHFRPRPKQHSNNGAFKNQVMENIDFVLKTYSERRDWSEQLHQQLRDEALLYAEQSTYIEVRMLDQYNLTPASLVASMKIVKVDPISKIKQLPMEKDFSINLPLNAGRKFEPSNFVVTKDSNKLGTSEIFTQLILHARDQLKNPNHETEKFMYFTPADRLGVKMYEKLGFRKVPGFELPLKERDKDWWMIGASAETLARLPERLAENKAQWKPEDVEWMSQLVSNFENLQGTRVELQGTRTKSLRTSKGAVDEIGVFISEPFTYKNKNYRRLSILSMNKGELEINLRIPESDLPLQNGWTFKQGPLHLLYKDGVFKMLDSGFKTSLTLKIDGSFRNPSYIWLQDSHNKLSGSF